MNLLAPSMRMNRRTWWGRDAKMLGINMKHPNTQIMAGWLNSGVQQQIFRSKGNIGAHNDMRE
jgi:hypothetical protein